jgi:hypothetical protein
LNQIVRIIITATALLPSCVFAQDVFVRAGEQTGGGLLRASGGDCYVITPAHVIGSQEIDIQIIAEGGRKGSANLSEKLSDDVALLKFDDHSRTLCASEGWPQVADVSSVLNNASNGILRGRGESGSRTQFAVSVEDYGKKYVTIVPSGTARIFSKGMSGSLLEINGLPIGLLVEVEPPRRGNVLRMDRILALLSDRFKDARPCQQSCEASTADLRREGMYSRPCDYPLNQPNMAACHQWEAVFALPSDWPIFSYAHFVTFQIGTLPAYLGAVNLSDSKQQKASDLIIINNLGVSSTHGATCLIEISTIDLAQNEYSVRLKNCMYIGVQ